MEISYKKAQHYLLQMEKLDFQSEALNYKKAICYICLENFVEARKQFAATFLEFQHGFKLWSLSNQPDLLVDTCILAGKADLAFQVRADLYNYAEARNKKSYLDRYALILLNLVSNLEDPEITIWIEELLGKPSLKEGYEMGNIFQSIIDRDQSRFNIALQKILAIHKNAARYGSLRDTPESLMSLNALSLAYCAARRNLDINYMAANFSIEYIKFLLTEKT